MAPLRRCIKAHDVLERRGSDRASGFWRCVFDFPTSTARVRRRRTRGADLHPHSCSRACTLPSAFLQQAQHLYVPPRAPLSLSRAGEQTCSHLARLPPRSPRPSPHRPLDAHSPAFSASDLPSSPLAARTADPRALLPPHPSPPPPPTVSTLLNKPYDAFADEGAEDEVEVEVKAKPQSASPALTPISRKRSAGLGRREVCSGGGRTRRRKGSAQSARCTRRALPGRSAALAEPQSARLSPSSSSSS